MAHTLELSVRAALSEGTTEIGKLTLTEDDAGGTEYAHDTTIIPASTTDFEIDLVGLTSAKYLVLSFSAACTLKLNADDETAFSVVRDGFIVLSGFAITSIFVTTTTSACTVKRIASDGS